MLLIGRLYSVLWTAVCDSLRFLGLDETFGLKAAGDLRSQDISLRAWASSRVHLCGS